MDYPGKVITKNAVIPTQTSAPGVWTLDDAAQAQKANSWPIPGVPNPISKSLRFNQADDTYLNRTPAVSGNRTTWTWSAWVKRSNLSDFQYSMYAGGSGSSYDEFRFNTSDQFRFFIVSGGSVVLDLLTTQVFRDPSAWYHFVVAYDSTQATSSNRAKLYVNGAQITTLSTATYPSQNTNSSINNSVLQRIGLSPSGFEYNGYMTEVNFIDGQALTPSDFGMTDTVTGVWVPKKYTGTYGTNGFYVNFKDSTNTTTLGYDYSGNGNNWNANNFSVTAGAGNDSLTDVPTPWVGYALNTEVGGVVRGNYATLNPLQTSTTYATISNGNLQYVDTTVAGSYRSAYSTIFATSGKFYFEATVSAVSGSPAPSIGLTSPPPQYDTYIEQTITGYQGYGYYADGTKATNDTYTAFGSTYTAGDTVAVAVDIDAGKVWFAKNGTWQASGDPATGSNPAFNIVTGRAYGFAVGSGSSATSIQMDCNFGQRPFAYTPPSGYKSLCTTNLPTPTIGTTSTTKAGNYFNTVLYTGDGTNPRSITGYGFSPDFIWQARRDVGYGGQIFDIVRGAGKRMQPCYTSAEDTYNLVGSFDSDGFTITGSIDQGNNYSSASYVAWAWRGSDSSAVSNTQGTITSTVSANTTSGFSVATYTGNGTSGTFGHGLGVAPSMVIIKCRSDAQNWAVWHKSLTSGYYIYLNTTGAQTNTSADEFFGNATVTVDPSSTVVSVGGANAVNNTSQTYVAYCFAPVAGYSAFGSWTGNGSSDGPFVYTGFRPAYILIKGISSNGYIWTVYDSKRNTYNVVNLFLEPDSANAEATFTTLDFLSNGIKIRSSDSAFNFSGHTYIYAAFAESPFKYALAR